MKLGMIGLGRMGANMVRRLMQGGHQCMLDSAARAIERSGRFLIVVAGGNTPSLLPNLYVGPTYDRHC